jgi:peptidoglycan-N-acetylmuramic acid deacetylase
MKTLARLLPLLVFVAFLVAIRLTGCRIGIPEGSQTTGTAEPTAAATTAASPTAAATKGATAGTREPTPAASTPAATTATSPTTTTGAPTPDWTTANLLAGLDNTLASWYYNPPSPLGEERPATIPAAVRQLAYQYEVIWQEPQTGRKVVYLTMDEGYEYGTNTEQILDIAKLKGISITFFITGSYLDKNPGLVGRMIDEGHLVANHTVSHPNLVDKAAVGGRSAILAELDGLAEDFEATCGVTMARYVRPPEGAYSDRVLAEMRAAGYRAVFWSFAYRDWLTDEQPDPAAAKEKILGQLHNGSVMLLHAVSATNVAILPDLIDEIKARGYQFALISELG